MNIALPSLSLSAFILSGFTPIASLQAAEMTLKINSDFPGGNVKVESIEGNKASIAPDLRDTTTNWFYWYFATEASLPGRADFIFNGANITLRGPAYSLDHGKTWQWLGKEHVTYSVPKEQPEESFYFNFTEPGQTVRFSVGFPYLESNLNDFLKANANNAHLSTSTLTKSPKGRPVELLQVGKPGEGISSVLVAARSHACEALASFVLEGFIAEAMSDSSAGVEFRKKYVLYAVPFLDKDGVEEGDQGKNRGPHDHNRDYGSTNIYPEIKAIQELAAAKDVRIGIDFHCPYLRGDVHEAYHWLGLAVPHILDNITEMNAWLAEERPLYANTAISFLKKPGASVRTENIPFSWYFAQQPQNLIGITLESPYAQAEDVDQARDYGRGLLRALVRTELIDSKPDAARGDGSFAKFNEFRKSLPMILGKPKELQAAIQPYLDASAPDLYRAQANLALATVSQRQRKFADAIGHTKTVTELPAATASQKATAFAQTIAILLANPDSTGEEIDAAVAALEAFEYAAPSHRTAGYRDASQYYIKNDQNEKALVLANKRIESAVGSEMGRALLDAATLLDTMDKKDDAIARRKEAIEFIRPQVVPKPNGPGVLLGIMTVNYFDALVGVPTSTQEEKVEAAKIVIEFPNLPMGARERVQAWLDDNAK